MSENNISDSERRKYIRVEQNSVLHCEPLTAKMLFNDNNQLGEGGGLVKNLSVGGILFETNQKYDLGIYLKVELNLAGWEKFKSEFYKANTGTKSKPLVVLARVMRVEMVGNNIYDIGLSIASIDKGHQEALYEFINAVHDNKKEQK